MGWNDVEVAQRRDNVGCNIGSDAKFASHSAVTLDENLRADDGCSAEVGQDFTCDIALAGLVVIDGVDEDVRVDEGLSSDGDPPETMCVR